MFARGRPDFRPDPTAISFCHAFWSADLGYHELMIRISPSLSAKSGFGLLALGLLGFAAAATPAFAQSAGTPSKAKVATTEPATTAKGKPASAAAKTPAKTDAKGKPAAATKTAKAETGEAAKPALVGTFGDWGAYLAAGKARTCYALGQPKERNPKDLKRDPAYVFISTRPGENVRNEVSIAMGFDVKATPEPKAEVGASSFALVAKGANLWVKNAAEEAPMLEAMRKTGKLVVRASSMKGNVTVDSYSLGGLSQALDRVRKDCP